MSTMISEAQRFEMHSKLRNLMGDEVANTLMEHLPPSGWADVARKSDVDRLEVDISRVDKSLKEEINGLKTAMWAMASIMTTGFVGLFALIVTKL